MNVCFLQDTMRGDTHENFCLFHNFTRYNVGAKSYMMLDEIDPEDSLPTSDQFLFSEGTNFVKEFIKCKMHCMQSDCVRNLGRLQKS